MEFRKTRILNSYKKLWRYRYKIYALIVVFFSIFIFQSDNKGVVPIVVSPDSLAYNVTKVSAFANELEYIRQDQVIAPKQVIYRDSSAEPILLDASSNYITDDTQISFYQKYGFAFQPPQVYINGKASTFVVTEKPLNDLVPAPEVAQMTNTIDIPKFNIRAPVIYTNPQDIFARDASGNIDYTHYIQEDQAAINRGDFTSTPVLRLLLDGVVSMNAIPGLVIPGELGHAYLVGHSTNYTTSTSPYKNIFEPMVNKVKVGDDFYIYDQLGRKLHFKVFTIDVVRYDEPEKAYKLQSQEYKDRRVVTLQTCIVKYVAGRGWVADDRYLVRGELVVD